MNKLDQLRTMTTVVAATGATLISPFVGRISDWYQKKTPHQSVQLEALIQQMGS